MKKVSRSPLVVLLMTIITVLLYLGGNLTYEMYLSGHMDSLSAFTADNGTYYGFIVPKVIDGFSNEPIEGATVVIPELHQSFKTGADGCTSKIRVPILPDQHFKSIMPKTWGETTLIVYKEGYIEYVLFCVHVWENQTRKGPEILLFPQDKNNGTDPFAIVEGPHRLWVKELVEKYRP